MRSLWAERQTLANPGFSLSTTMKPFSRWPTILSSSSVTMPRLPPMVSMPLEILRRNQDVTVLFSDISMPGMNGEELARAAAAVRPGLRVIFTSGGDRRPTIAAAFVPKPYRADDLIDVLGSEIMTS